MSLRRVHPGRYLWDNNRPLSCKALRSSHKVFHGHRKVLGRNVAISARECLKKALISKLVESYVLLCFKNIHKFLFLSFPDTDSVSNHSTETKNFLSLPKKESPERISLFELETHSRLFIYPKREELLNTPSQLLSGNIRHFLAVISRSTHLL